MPELFLFTLFVLILLMILKYSPKIKPKHINREISTKKEIDNPQSDTDEGLSTTTVSRNPFPQVSSWLSRPRNSDLPSTELREYYGIDNGKDTDDNDNDPFR